MQKFKVKLKNVPTDAPQVRSSTNSVLNKDQSLSVPDKVLALNNLEVDQHQHKDGQNMSVSATVYVLNKRGSPLMPCSARTCRKLLNKGAAKVVKTNPFFVIQLTNATGENKQEADLGIDSGYKFVGFSVITNKKELVCGELELDQKTSDRLKEKKMYRIHRRNKLWYRKPRWNNRKINKGWLPPSTLRRFNTHVKLITILKSILPIKNTTIEVGNFDIQKIENPDITGIQYQQGSRYGYQNTRAFLMARERGKCQICGKEFSKGNPSHIHHIISRSKGGTDREKNLALVHEKCHNKLHRQNKLSLLKKNKQYKDSTFMSTIRGKFKEVFPDCNMTYGNETFVNRNNLWLEKTHYNDAFVIAGGTNQAKIVSFKLNQKHKNGRVLQVQRNGFKPSIRRQRYSIQPYDIITVNNKKFIVKGSHCYGNAVECTDNIIKFNFGIKKIKNVFHTATIYRREI